MSMHKISEFKKNWKQLFCYGFILIGVLFVFVILIFKPLKIETGYVYQYSNKVTKEEVSFPILQHITFQEDNLKLLNIFFRNDSFEGFSYQVKLLDFSGEEYFNVDSLFDQSAMISIPLENLNLEKNVEYILKVECNLCDSAEVSVKESNSNEIYLENSKEKKTLEMIVQYASKNNSYFWYSALIIVIGFTLLPIAKGEENEKN